jgi:hypothetical protein
MAFPASGLGQWWTERCPILSGAGQYRPIYSTIIVIMMEGEPETEPKIVPLDPLIKLFRNTGRLYKERFVVLVNIFLPSVLLIVATLSLVLQFQRPLLLVVNLFITGFAAGISSVAAVFAITKKTGFVDSYRRTFGIFGAVLWVETLMGLVFMGAAFLLFVPAIFAVIWLLFTRFVLVEENARGFAVLQQSREYARGYGWPLFWRSLIYYAPIAIISSLVSLFWGSTAAYIEGAVLNLFTLPFLMVYVYAIYENIVALKPVIRANRPQETSGFFALTICFGLTSIAILIAFALMPKPLPAQSGWERYTSPHGSFSVLLPNIPTGNYVDMRLPGWPTVIPQEMYSAGQDTGSDYYVGFSALPQTADSSYPKKILTEVLNWFTGTVSGTIASSNFTTFGTSTVIDYRVSESDGTDAKGEGILIGTNFYQLFEHYAPQNYSENNYEKFINSFQLIPASTTSPGM